MRLVNARRLLAPTVILAALASLGCPPPPTKYSAAEKHTGPAVSKEALPGSAFNKFFPKPEGDFDVVYDQEKTGTVVASLKKGGTKVADLSVFDTVSKPETAEEFAKSTEKVDDKYPARHTGQRSSILVGDRLSVMVANDGDAPDDLKLNKEERIAWLKKFDLDGLAALVK
jgi:hypothetical protein